MKDRGQIKLYDQLLKSTMENVTPPHLRYVFGYLMVCGEVTPDEFVRDKPMDRRSFPIKTVWTGPLGDIENERIEFYGTELIVPSSAVIWLRNRLGLRNAGGMLSNTSITGWNYQSKWQHRALMAHWWTWYTEERYEVHSIHVPYTYHSHTDHIP